MMTGTSARSSLTFGSISSPLMPGMLMSDRIRISDCPVVAATRASASAAELAKSIRKRCARKSWRNCWRNSASTSGSSSTTKTRTLTSRPLIPVCNAAGARQPHRKFGELPRFGFDLDRTAVLLYDDVVTHRQAEPGAFTRRLGGEERVEHLFPHLGRNAGAVVADSDFDAVAEVAAGDVDDGIKGLAGFGLALGHRVKGVADQIEENSGDFLRKQLDHAGGGIEVALQRDIE